MCVITKEMPHFSIKHQQKLDDHTNIKNILDNSELYKDYRINVFNLQITEQEDSIE